MNLEASLSMLELLELLGNVYYNYNNLIKYVLLHIICL